MISPIRKNDKQKNEPRVLPLDCYKTEIISPIKEIDKQENEPTKTYDDSEPTQINPLASLVFFFDKQA